jgi:hypothetical protein
LYLTLLCSLQELGIGEEPEAAPAEGPGWAFPAASAAPPSPPSGAAAPLGLAAWPSPGEDQEDADLAAAMKASMEEQGRPAAASPWIAALGGAPATAAAATGGEELAAPGLSNETGEYNCFLNVVVQCLWHCSDFSAAVTAWPPEVYARDAVVAALHSLFASFAAADAARAAGGPRPLVNPSALREALAALPGREFRAREMSDAAEVLLTLYERMREASASAGGAVVDSVFGLHVEEKVACGQCGLTTQASSFVQHLFTTQATALRLLAREGAPLGALLRDIEAQAPKTCDTDAGGCGVWNPVSHTLRGLPPRVFTLQLAWESQAEEPEAIAGTMRAVRERVDLADVYGGVAPGRARYRLRCMVAYYGQHYQALVLAPETGRWALVDDARATAVGAWADVVRKCQAGRIQPSVLFFEAEGEGEGASEAGAPALAWS